MFLRVGFVVFLILSSTGCVFSFLENTNSFPIGTTDDDFPSYERYNAETPSIKESPSQITLEVLKLLEDIFQSPQVGDIKCTNVSTFQKFVERYFVDENGTVPKLNFLCLVKYEKSDDELNWVLSAPPGNAWHLLPPTGLIDTDMSIVRNVEVNLESSLRIHQEEGLTRISMGGVKFNLSKKAVEGSPLSWVPEALLKFRVNYVELKDSGAYSIHLLLPLGIPFSTRGMLAAYLKEKSIKFQGQNFQLAF